MTVSRADNGDDPAIDAFLGFLATDIKQHPEKIKALSPGLAERITALTNGILVNLDDEIDGDVAL
ncbi:MAG: type II toxin-antitoxin system PrlF family antitoxin [Parasphingorhabdus sp.]